MKQRTSRRRPVRWAIAIAAAASCAAAYRHYTDPDLLRARCLAVLGRHWQGTIALDGVGYTPWGGLVLTDLELLQDGAVCAAARQLRVRLSPARAILGESMVSEVAVDGVDIHLPEGALHRGLRLPAWPIAQGPSVDGAAPAPDVRGSLVVTVTGARILQGKSEAMALPLAAFRCRYHRVAGTMDVTGEIAGPHWSPGSSFRVSFGKGTCWWDGALHALKITPEVRGMLWPGAREIVDMLKATGAADVAARGTYDAGASPSTSWRVDVTASNAEITCRHFPLPVEKVRGCLTLDETGRAEITEASGRTAGALVACEGTIRWKGGRPLVDLDFTVTDLPMVPAIVAAMPPGLRAALDRSGAEGRVSGRFRMLWSRTLPEPLCFRTSMWTDGLVLRRLPLQPVIREARLGLSGRTAGGFPVGMTGEAEVAQAEISGRPLAAARAAISWEGPDLRIALTDARFGGGNATGLLTRSAEGPRWGAVLDLADAEIEDLKRGTLIADQDVCGRFSAHLDVAWTGNDAGSLRGTGNARIEDGKLFTMRPLNALLKVVTLNPVASDTVIRGGRVDFSLDGREIEIRRLDLPNDQFTVRVSGRVGGDGSLDLRAIGSPGQDKAFRKIPVLKETLEGLKGFMSWLQARGLHVVRIRGTIRDPKVERITLFVAKEEVTAYRDLLNAARKDKE